MPCITNEYVVSVNVGYVKEVGRFPTLAMAQKCAEGNETAEITFVEIDERGVVIRMEKVADARRWRTNV